MLVRVFLSCFIAALAGPAVAEPVRSGQAAVEWISGSTAYAAGKPIHTGVRVTIDEGWHTYWINPGEAGEKLAVEWELPAGWTASGISFPVPKRFLTGELPGYGYEHEVIFPVTITPPKGAAGPVELAAKVSWLTCNNASCVPGKAELKLALGGGDPAASSDTAEAISKAESQVPKTAAGVKLVVRESGKLLNLSLSLPSSSKLDPPGSEVFPETLQAVDHYQPIRFQKTGPTWSATVKKSEYAEGPLKELKLVLAKSGTPPVEVIWKAP
jgi:thiol:disulfide interchange protein DsbD